MRNISRSEYMQGLNSDAANAVRACDSTFGHYYNERFHQLETISEAVKNFQAESLTQQRQMAELKKHLDYVKQSFCETVDDVLVTAHRTVENLRRQSEVIAKENDHDPV